MKPSLHIHTNPEAAKNCNGYFKGMERVGWLWRTSQNARRWTFTTTLDVRGYPHTAEFMTMYAEAKGARDNAG